MIQAEVHSDDHLYEIVFDAELWFQSAEDSAIEALANCEWGGDYPADAVVEFMSDHNTEIADMFRYLERVHNIPIKDAPGFECHVRSLHALVWLETNKPELFRKIAGPKENA